MGIVGVVDGEPSPPAIPPPVIGLPAPSVGPPATFPLSPTGGPLDPKSPDGDEPSLPPSGFGFAILSL